MIQLLTKIKITIITIYFKKNAHVNNINLIYFDRIDVSEGIDVNELNGSKECDICDYWYFLSLLVHLLVLKVYISNRCL